MIVSFLFGPIGAGTLDIIQEIRQYAAHTEDKEKVIKLIISSEGGEERAGYAIYDTLMAFKKSGGKVITEGYGEVSSIASLIFQAGDMRLLAPNAVFMIHNGTVETHSPMDLEDIRDIERYFQEGNVKYCSIISKRSKIPLDRVTKWCNNETFFSAEEAVKAKLADGIVRKL